MAMGLGSLTGSLEGDKLLLQMDALAKAQQEQLASSTQSATQAAGQAAQQYQQLAQQPPPQLNPMSQLLSTLGGGVASVLEGNQGPTERARQDIQQSKAQLFKQRADNLQALGDVYQQKAAEAQKAGDLETTEKYRRQFETLQKQWEIVNANAQRAAAEDRDAARAKAASDLQAQRDAAAEQRQVLRDKAAAGGGIQDFAASVQTRELPDGTQAQYVVSTPSQVPSIKERTALNNFARANKIAIAGDRENNVLQLIDSVRGDMADVANNVIPKLPETGGLGRVTGGLANQFKALAQLDPTLSGYPAFRTAAIKTIQTLASLGKGLRINQAEIQAAQNFDFPRIDDSQGTAKEKFRILGMMMEHLENAALGRTVPNQESLKVIKAIRNLNVQSNGGPPQPGFKGSGSAPGAKNGALKAATSKNREEFIRLLKANPGLDSDPEIIAAARKLKAAGG